MKIVRYLLNDQTYLGILEDEVIYQVSDHSDILLDLNRFNHLDTTTLTHIPLQEVKILSPIEKTYHDIICVGVNYYKHLEESIQNLGFHEVKDTVYFSKRATTILGPNDSLQARFDLDEGVDYECELAVIISKEGKHISKDKVEDYIFGYTILNDFSSRNLQVSHSQWFYGKSIDTYTSIGPYIITKDELPLPHNLQVQSYVNNELRKNSNTTLMMKSVADIISELSETMTLLPGDIIATGTPSGVGVGFNPPKFLKENDVVKCSIEGLGTLTNTVQRYQKGS